MTVGLFQHNVKVQRLIILKVKKRKNAVFLQHTQSCLLNEVSHIVPNHFNANAKVICDDSICFQAQTFQSIRSNAQLQHPISPKATREI